MKQLLALILVPLGAVGSVIGAATLGVSQGWISDEVQFYLWGSLVAFFLLAFALVALMRRLYVLLWPFGLGFLAALTGVLLLVVGVIDSRWVPVFYALIAVGVVLLVMLIVYVVSTIRARLLEKSMAAGAAGADGADVERIRKDMLEALDLLRRAGRGRNAIYDLPWFLVMGRPAAGKTVAIKNSELGLPVKRDWVKGVGGTYTADWFFTNEMIFLDTPGKWVTDGATEDGQAHWRELIRLLRKYRGRQPLDGLIVVVPADDLLSLGDEELEDQAANIREVVDLIHSELKFRFPIYLLVSKSDLVDGFVEFFKILPAKRRHEILGWSNSDPNSRDVPALIEEGFERLNRHLAGYRIEMLGRVAKRTQARRLFFFTEELKALERPLITFAEALFSGDRYSDSPVFRGFYFTSGTQEGAPLSKAVAELARTLGVPAVRTAEAEEGEQKRSYFLLDLFRQVMVGDDGLVGRTAGHRWRLRRNTFLGAFAPAGIALVFLLLSLIAFVRNGRTYSAVERSAAELAQQLASQRASEKTLDERVESALPLTAQLQEYHERLVGFDPFRRFGMRKPGGLEPRLFELYRTELQDSVLKPTLAAAAALATDPDPETSCADRIAVLHSVVWLRMGRRAGYEQLAGLDRVWELDQTHFASRAAGMRQELRRQFKHLEKHARGQDLLPGFDVRTVAKSIAEDCGKQGDLSTLALYDKFQSKCPNPVTNMEIEDCWSQLRHALRNSELDFEGFSSRFKGLQEDLETLRSESLEAGDALKLLGKIDMKRVEVSGCLTEFDQEISPLIESYAEKDDLLEECKSKVEGATGSKNKYQVRQDVLKQQEVGLADDEQKLGSQFASYSDKCADSVAGFKSLDLEVLKRTVLSQRRLECYRLDAPATRPPLPPPGADRGQRAPGPAPARPASTPARASSPTASRYDWFESPASVKSNYDPDNWENQKLEWAARLEAAQTGFTPDQKANEERQVAGAVSGYAASYATAWIEYLKSLRLKSPTGPVPAWIKELATTGEYALLLGRAQQAARLAASAGEPPFDVLAQKLGPLAGLTELDLAAYQAQLENVAGALARCERDPDEFRRFRATLGTDDNALVRAQRWVAQNAGASVLGGSLTALFRTPLDWAEQFAKSDSLLKNQWDLLHKLYAEEIEGRPPFGGKLMTDEAAGFGPVKALLGGATGVVVQVRQAAGASPLAPDAEAWLRRAESLSALLFDSGSDSPRAVKLGLALQEERYAEKEFEKNFRLERVKMQLADAAVFEWTAEEAAERKDVLRLPLLGDDASVYSVLKGTVAERKGFAGRMIGSKFKEGENLDAVLASDPSVKALGEEALAPLKLLALGQQSGGELVYALDIPWKKEKSARIEIVFVVSGEDWARLSDLIQNGLGPPPPTIIGG